MHGIYYMYNFFYYIKSGCLKTTCFVIIDYISDLRPSNGKGSDESDGEKDDDYKIEGAGQSQG